MPKKYKSAPTGRIFSTKEEAQADAYGYHVGRRLSEQTKRTPIRYIGGEPDEARDEFWRQEPVLQHAVDSVANLYGISSDVLKARINKEGFVDSNIRDRNYLIKSGHSKNIPRGYEILSNYSNTYEGTNNFGLDTVGDLLSRGKIKLKGKKFYEKVIGKDKTGFDKYGYVYKSPEYHTYDWVNEKNITTNAASGVDIADNFGITAATLRYLRDKAKQDYPNASDYDLDRYSLAYFHRGETGGRKWVNDGAKGYNYRRRLESRGKLTK